MNLLLGPHFEEGRQAYNSYAACLWSSKFTVSKRIQTDYTHKWSAFKLTYYLKNIYLMYKGRKALVGLYNANVWTLPGLLIFNYGILFILDARRNYIESLMIRMAVIRGFRIVALRQNILDYYEVKGHVWHGHHENLNFARVKENIIIFIGLLSESRDLSMLEDLCRPFEGYRLVFVSRLNSDYKQQVIRMCLRLNINVEIHDYLTEEAKKDILRLSKYGLILRSDHLDNRYNFPSKLIEYFNYGLMPLGHYRFDDIDQELIFESKIYTEEERIFRISAGKEYLKRNHDRFVKSISN